MGSLGSTLLAVLVSDIETAVLLASYIDCVCVPDAVIQVLFIPIDRHSNATEEMKKEEEKKFKEIGEAYRYGTHKWMCY